MPQSPPNSPPNKKRRVETDPVGKKSKPRSSKNSREKADINIDMNTNKNMRKSALMVESKSKVTWLSKVGHPYKYALGGESGDN